MTSDTLTLKLQLDVYAMAEAARRRRGGSQVATPIEFALQEKTAFVQAELTEDRLVITRTSDGKRYTGPMPAELSAYLARFRAGEWIQETHTFELVLVSFSLAPAAAPPRAGRAAHR